MRRRVKAIALARENVGFSPFLPLAAGMLIALFAVSLAMAEPRNETSVVATHDATVGIGTGIVEGGLATDALPADTELSSRPLRQHYPDRYEFYHRYDHGLTSRNNPYDDGMN